MSMKRSPPLISTAIMFVTSTHHHYHLLYHHLIDHHRLIILKQHTYRDFLALLPSRRWNIIRKEKYANRLTNYESYYRSPIKRWIHKYSVILQLQHLSFDDDYDDYDDGDEDHYYDLDDCDQSGCDDSGIILNSQNTKININE